MSTLTTRVFMNGNSQAVRIPAEFKLSVDRVQISRNAAGELVIRPFEPERGKALLELLQGFDEEFVAALMDDREADSPAQERDPL